ncbi:MAG: replicative DNA helicase [Usitatibacter sp.]
MTDNGLIAREAEQAVLGGLLISNDSLDRIAETVRHEDFGVANHAVIFAAITGLIERGQPADVISVMNQLRADGTLAQVGGLEYLTALLERTPSAANIRTYAAIVRDRALLRGLRRLAGDALNASEEKGQPQEIATELEVGLISLFDRSEGEPVFLKDALAPVIEYLDERSQNPGSLAGIGTGFSDFDRMTWGLEPGDVMVVGARPAMGKSAFGLNIASNVAARYGTTYFWSGEMPLRQLVLREIAGASGISMTDMRSGELSRDDWNRIGDVVAKLSELPVSFDERTGMSVSKLRATLRKMKRKHGLHVAVLDYIGLMQGEGDTRVQELGSISCGIKRLAKELAIPIIVLAQLNRANESRVDKRPMMSDLRDSGEIEQDADIIVFLHREEYYKPDDPTWKGVAELLIRKQRNGPVGDVQLMYDSRAVRFRDMDRGSMVRREAPAPKTPKSFDD